MIAVTPSIQKTLKIFDPTIFPMAISDWLRRAAIIEVANSGSEVPTATMVRPISNSESQSARARSEAPDTNIFPPINSPIKPNTI